MRFLIAKSTNAIKSNNEIYENPLKEEEDNSASCVFIVYYFDASCLNCVSYFWQHLINRFEHPIIDLLVII